MHSCWLVGCRYDYLFDPDEPDEFKVPCLCKAPNCRIHELGHTPYPIVCENHECG
jgi:hypothetical protein